MWLLPQVKVTHCPYPNLSTVSCHQDSLSLSLGHCDSVNNGVEIVCLHFSKNSPEARPLLEGWTPWRGESGGSGMQCVGIQVTRPLKNSIGNSKATLSSFREGWTHVCRYLRV